VDDESRQEEADEQWRSQLDSTLIRSGGPREADEEEKAAQEQRRVVRVEHRPRHEHQVDGDNPRRDGQKPGPGRVLVGLLDIGHRPASREPAQLVTEKEEVDGCGNQNRETGAPSEVRHHERDVPSPGPRHHQHRRRRELGERATDGDIHEQHAQGGVFEPHGWLQIVKLPGEQQRADRHRGRFRDE
jgi:hypothetical protein